MVAAADFKWLLLALMMFLIGVPIADDLGATGKPLVRIVSFSALLGIGVISLYGSRNWFRIGMTFAVAGIAINLTAANVEARFLVHGSYYSMMGFLITAILFTFRRVALDTEITANRIVGAVVAYLLLGVLWAISYATLTLYQPGAFTGFEINAHSTWDSEWLYFSFVTMTTLGYGDIVPVTATARVLAYMQAMFGQFYIAILVAGLVGAYVGRDQ